MLPAFGFSIGDFIASINLIRELTKALEDGSGACAEFRLLIRELYTLEHALLEVKSLQQKDHHQQKLLALHQAASQCQNTILEFLNKIKRFQPSLSVVKSKESWRDRLRQIEWRLYKQDEVKNFRAQLAGHSASINILLITLQL
jgi:hypothetical protein